MTMHQPRASRQFVTDGASGLTDLQKNMAAAMSGLRSGETLREYAGRRDDVVAKIVSTVLAAIDGADAFDVLDLMRQRVVVAKSMGYEDPKFAATPVAIEIVAAIALARGTRSPAIPSAPDAAQKSLDVLLDSAAQALVVGGFAFMAEAAASTDELSKLIAEYRGSLLQIRNKQYEAFHDRLNKELFDGAPELERALGFTFSEYLAVREAIDDGYMEDYGSAMDTWAAVAKDWSADRQAKQSNETIELGQAAVMALHITPGARASFTAQEIAARSGVAQVRVTLILDTFSASFIKADPVRAVLDILDGNNPFSTAALIKDSVGNYLQLALPIGTDCLRQVAEERLKGTPQFQPYNERRKEVSERLSIEYLESALGVPVVLADFHYFAPNKGVDVTELGSSALKITAVGKDCEADALFIIGDVAICVEVKASSLTPLAKRGDPTYMRRDLNTTIGSATSQAHRLENLIEENGGVWLGDRSWFDLTAIREVRSIAICVDDLGPLGTALDALVRGGIITDTKFPWIVTLSDLSTISEVVDRPAEFLLYLRRRTEPSTSRRFSAIDELDMFMFFLKGGLYLQPDPDAMFARYPDSSPPTDSERRQYAAQADTVRIDVHTDSLDAWMQTRQHIGHSPKPTFDSDPGVLAIVDFLADGQKPGWFRFGADLLNLASEPQHNVVAGMKRIAAQTRRDKQHHSFAMGFAGAWGYPILFGYTREKSRPIEDALEDLDLYMVAKKHQTRADRALGLLSDDYGQIRAVRYANNLFEPDADIDELVKEMRLIPAERMGRAIPPSARRTTKRLASSKKNKKR